MVPGMQVPLKVETCVQVDQLSGWCPGLSPPQLESQVDDVGKGHCFSPHLFHEQQRASGWAPEGVFWGEMG